MTRRKKNPQSSKIMWVMGLPLLLAVVSLGCGLSGAIANLRAEPTFEPTRTPMPTFTATPRGESFLEVATPEPVVEENPATEPVEAESDAVVEEPGEAVEEVDEEVAAQEEAVAAEEEAVAEEAAPAAGTTVTLTVRQDMNVRTGPGTNYPVAGPGPAGSLAQVLGRNADASWLQVEYPPGSGSKGWLYADLVDVSGDPVAVAVVNAPAAPAAAPAPAPQPQAEAPPPAPPQPQYQFTPGAWHASENAAIVHFKGRIKDEGGNLVNGYSVHVNNGSWGVLSHPTGASVWYPEYQDGFWDVAGVQMGSAQGWWWLSVVRYECNFAAGFDAQCKNFTTLSEEVKIEVRSPEQSVINADWTCHWDCDKGLYTQPFRRN